MARKVFGAATPAKKTESVESKVQRKNKITEQSGVKEYEGQKWGGALDDLNATQATLLNAKVLPLEHIQPDEYNPRVFQTSYKEFCSAPKLPQSAEVDSEVWKQYENNVSKHIEGNKTKLSEIMSVAKLALTIPEPASLVEPIVTYSMDSGFKLIDGYRRFLAHILRSHTQIKSIISEPPGDLDTRLMQWCANVQHEDIGLSGRIKNVKLIIIALNEDSPGQSSVRKLATRMGSSVTTVQRLKTISMDQSPEFQSAIEFSLITDELLAYDISKLDEPLKSSVIEYAKGKGGITRQNFKKVCELLLNQNSDNSTKKTVVDHGLRLGRNVDHKPISKIIQAALSLPELSSIQKELQTMDLSDKGGVLDAWDLIYRSLSEE